MGQEELRILIERRVAGIWIDNELCVRQVLLQCEAVDRGDDQVVAAVDHEHRMTDFRQVIPHAIGLLVRLDDRRVLRGGGRLADLRATILAAELALEVLQSSRSACCIG